MQKEPQVFSESFKLMVIKQVMSGSLSKEEARRQYGLKGKSGILRWQRNYEKYGCCSLNLAVETVSPLKAKKSSKSKTTEDLESRIKELERLLEDEQLRSEAYQRMIDIAEKELNIPIRKKSNTK